MPLSFYILLDYFSFILSTQSVLCIMGILNLHRCRVKYLKFQEIFGFSNKCLKNCFFTKINFFIIKINFFIIKIIRFGVILYQNMKDNIQIHVLCYWQLINVIIANLKFAIITLMKDSVLIRSGIYSYLFIFSSSRLHKIHKHKPASNSCPNIRILFRRCLQRISS